MAWVGFIQKAFLRDEKKKESKNSLLKLINIINYINNFILITCYFLPQRKTKNRTLLSSKKELTLTESFSIVCHSA